MTRFIIEQKITLMANQYRVFAADSTGNKQELVAFAHQKRLALKERFDFYTDETKQTVLFSVQARSVMDVNARFDVTDASGTVLGVLGKAFKASLLRSTWNMYRPGDEDVPLVIASERSKPIAIIRRVWSVLPILGDWPFFIKYHFDFKRPNSDEIVASYNKIATIHDHYLLTIEDSLEQAADWRVPVALGIMMDALQSR